MGATLKSVFRGRVYVLALTLCVSCGGDSDNGDAAPFTWPETPLEFDETLFDTAGTTTHGKSGENLAQLTQTFALPGPIAPTQRWTQRTNGLCGNTCRNGPRHMYSAAFEDTLLVSWMAVDQDDPWRHYGNVATFTVNAQGEFTLKKNVSFDGLCAATYGITTNEDGSVIAVLCRGDDGVTTPYPQATHLLDTRRKADCNEDWEGRCYPIGNYSSHDSALYVMEFRGGEVTGAPDDIVYLNHAVGGWRYGHHEISLNRAEDTYFLHLKVTAGPSADNRHEGLAHFALKRTPEFAYEKVTDEWGCGAGHVLANRVAYNESEDTWGQLCMLDSCRTPSQFENGKCNAISFFTAPGVTGAPSGAEGVNYEGEYLLELDQGQNSWNMSGGVGDLLSLGADGFLALASGPGYPSAVTKPDAIGLYHVPKSVPELMAEALDTQVPQYESGTLVGNQSSPRYQWQWLYLPDPDPALERERRFGMANMAYFDTKGEQSDRLLLGWSPSMATQGIAQEYVVSEIDRSGQLRGSAFTLEGAGWGEDNLWQTMPSSGCVVFPFAFSGDAPGGNYPVENNDRLASDFPTTLHMTSLCPVGSTQPPPASVPAPQSDAERWPSP